MLGVTPEVLGTKPVRCPCGHVGFSIHHAFSNCKFLNTATSWRHNTTLREVRLGARVAGMDTVLENKQFQMESRMAMGTVEHCRRGDLLACDGEVLRDTDLSVVHGAHASYRNAASKQPGGAVAMRDKVKHQRHDPGRHSCYEFLALSLDTYGCMSQDFKQFVRWVTDKAGEKDCVDKHVFRRWWIRRMSVAHLRGCLRLVSRYVGASIKSVGRNFEPRDEYVALT